MKKLLIALVVIGITISSNAAFLTKQKMPAGTLYGNTSGPNCTYTIRTASYNSALCTSSKSCVCGLIVTVAGVNIVVDSSLTPSQAQQYIQAGYLVPANAGIKGFYVGL